MVTGAAPWERPIAWLQDHVIHGMRSQVIHPESSSNIDAEAIQQAMSEFRVFLCPHLTGGFSLGKHIMHNCASYT